MPEIHQSQNSREPSPNRSEKASLSEQDALRFFTRSPHPYHRHRVNKSTDKPTSDELSRHNDTPPAASSPSQSDPEVPVAAQGNGKSRRNDSATPSESGTEADDEGYGFIKALPAPPIKPRKGLRDIRGANLDGTPSPLLTPSQLDNQGRNFSQDFLRAIKKSETIALSDDEARAARAKYIKRRRAEVVRRLSEIALLGTIGGLILSDETVWRSSARWHRALIAHGIVSSFLILLYPIRLIFHLRNSFTALVKGAIRRIRVPPSFDPAPLLYPVFIPVFVALSLSGSLEHILLPNLVLSLSTLPTSLIPGPGRGLGYNTVHWLVACAPIFASEHADKFSRVWTSRRHMSESPLSRHVNPEMLVSLFALHQALIPPLQYLTTTSLLPAELQMLSVALINLLLFADSPQAIILATLMWLGGLALFVCCGHVLHWSVTLARIPKWRFRRAGQLVRARQSFLSALSESLAFRRRSSWNNAIRDGSDSDADNHLRLAEKDPGPLKRLKLVTSESARFSRTNLDQDACEVRSAVEHPRKDMFGAANQENGFPRFLKQRSNTLPTFKSRPSPPRRSSTLRHKRAKPSIAQSYLSMTPTQAAVQKWLYAGYVYTAILLIILLPIRAFISAFALHGHEPFGWALSYLFGNIPYLRFQTVYWGLEHWILLPALPSSSPLDPSLGRANYLRHVLLGAANTRLLLFGYWAGILILGLAVVLSLSSIVEVDTRRKVFHGMMVAMLLPTIYIDPAFVSLALELVLAVFLLLDLIRASQLPPLSGPIAKFLTPYVDGRDLRGPVVVSHIFLLIGCAIPLWLSLAGIERAGERPWEGWEVASRDVSMIAGVVCVGMGDAAASLVGRRYGRRKWPWTGGKSLEGSLAFAVAVTVGLVFGKAWLRLGQWDTATDIRAESWGVIAAKAGVAACGASFMEAVLTGGNDNVCVPVVLWLLVRAVGL
ncbi:dolichol kinase [Coniosporium apollinis]|uniref:dolichol kinase n=1 Tax=Coniosporium apollinis TaxID=61459 RepID=A0ABQ9NJ36_9PEZI|nr:dolichol kinase [Coniosporium apollinis]